MVLLTDVSLRDCLFIIGQISFDVLCFSVGLTHLSFFVLTHIMVSVRVCRRGEERSEGMDSQCDFCFL